MVVVTHVDDIDFSIGCKKNRCDQFRGVDPNRCLPISKLALGS